MNNYPELMSGAPQWIIWGLGLVFILLACGLVYSVIAIAFSIYREAQERRTWPVAWLIAGLIGGWLTALIWLVVKDRLPDTELEKIMAGATRRED